MTDNWKDLKDMFDVSSAQANGWEIQVKDGDGYWVPWSGNDWDIGNLYRGRPPQPKTRTVTLEMWMHTESGSTTTRLAGNTDFEGLPNWARFPAGDIAGEVEA
jgi:hypothetical protein